MAVKIIIFLLPVLVVMHMMHAHSLSLLHKLDTDAEKNHVKDISGKLFGSLRGKKIRSENLPLSSVDTQGKYEIFIIEICCIYCKACLIHPYCSLKLANHIVILNIACIPYCSFFSLL